MLKGILDGPIPGENFTSDTKNYPWHRPPEFDDMNEAVDYCMEKLTEPRSAMGLLTLMDAGMTVAQATDIFVTNGIGSGKWTPDYAILLAGPVANIIELIAKSYGMDYKMGTEQEPLPTFAMMRALRDSVDQGKATEAAEDVSDAMSSTPEEPTTNVPKEATGFMGAKAPSGTVSTDEQEAMLGAI